MKNVMDCVEGAYWNSTYAVAEAVVYNDKIDTLIQKMVDEGRVTVSEQRELEDLKFEVAAVCEGRRFSDGIRFGVQFMASAMQQIKD